MVKQKFLFKKKQTSGNSNPATQQKKYQIKKELNQTMDEPGKENRQAHKSHKLNLWKEEAAVKE